MTGSVDIGSTSAFITTRFDHIDWLTYFSAFFAAISVIVLGVVATWQSKKAYDLQDKQHNQQQLIEETRQRLSVQPVFDCRANKIKAIVSVGGETSKYNQLWIKQINSEQFFVQAQVLFFPTNVSEYETGPNHELIFDMIYSDFIKGHDFYQCVFENTGLGRARVCEVCNITEEGNDVKILNSCGISEKIKVVYAVPITYRNKKTPFVTIFDFRDVFGNLYRQIFQFEKHSDNIRISVSYNEPGHSNFDHSVHIKRIT